MSRYYSDMEKQQVLQQLINNGYNVRLTSAQTGVPERTLTDWRRKYLLPEQRRQYFRGMTSLATPLPIQQLPANKLEALRDIQRDLMEKAKLLSLSIDDAIIEAPLVQRSAALVQIIDRIVKISTLVPPDPQDDLLEGDIDGDETDGETQVAQSASQTTPDPRQ